MKNGKGIEEYAKGGKYSGDWSDNQKNGMGMMK